MDKKVKKLWILAGETSGDIYGAKLASELKKIASERNVELKLAGMGSKRMAEEGVELLVDSTELGVMGLVETLKLIGTFVRIFFKLVNLAKEERPDAVVLIDYPGFNLRFAKKMFKLNIPVIWYVSPQIWVWGKKRKPVLEAICSKMLVIFPFETEVYDKDKLDVSFVGHPLLEIIEDRTDLTIKRDENCFLLLPGSRAMEVGRLLKPMLDAVCELHSKHPNLYFVIAASRAKMRAMCEKIIADYRKKHPELPPIELSNESAAYYQQKAGTGIAASGTVTVESAIAGLPLVVIYKLNYITLLIASVLVKLYRGYFTMVNIIANKTVFEEFLQWHVCNKNIVPAVEKILPGGSRRKEVENDIENLVEMLSSRGRKPSFAAAEACFEVIEKQKVIEYNNQKQDEIK
ncbi:MAG: lipid-A-disaccharide synthase [Lentisphaeria bacterium]|nr:lipid-A-disaccharide synthase [Lentisphaeria bacterium]